MTLAIRESCAHIGKKYLSIVEKVAEGPLATAPFISSATLGAMIATVAKILGRTTSFWPTFQTIFTVCTVTHSAILSPLQPFPEKRNRYQSLIKSIVHTAWSLRAGVMNALLFDLFKHISVDPIRNHKYLLGFWDLISIVTILPPFASPICGLKAGMMLVGGVSAVSFVSKWTSDYFHKDDVVSTERLVPTGRLALPSPTAHDPSEFDQEKQTFWNDRTKKFYLTPPPMGEIFTLIEKYVAGGETGMGYSAGRETMHKNLGVDGHPKQLCDIFFFKKRNDQIAFEEDERKEKLSRKTIWSTCFQQLDYFRTLFSWELVPRERRGALLRARIQRQQELAAELSEELTRKLTTCWKDRYSSYLICGERELREMDISETRTSHVLVLFYKLVPETPKP